MPTKRPSPHSSSRRKSKALKLNSFRQKSPLQEAYQIGLRSHKYKFDWEKIEDVVAKVDEELVEVKTAQNHLERLNEIGDLLFATAQMARHYKIDPEKALAAANKKFNQRFEKMIEVSGLSRKEFFKLSLDQKDQYWHQVKKILAKK